MSNFQKLSLGVSRQAPIQGTDIASGSATNGQVLTADGSGNSAFVMPSSTSAIAPTIQIFLSGSGTYTMPAGVLYIEVEMVGGGGGGGSGGAGASDGGGTGGTSTFGTSLLAAYGGVGGGPGNSGGGGGGTNSGGGGNNQGTNTQGGAATVLVDTPGNFGGSGIYVISGDASSGPGGVGGVSPFGGGVGSSFNTGGDGGVDGTGSGGAGGASTGEATWSGGGGQSGEYVRAFITGTLSSTYSYVVGGGGTGGADANAGGSGGSGIIIVTEYYSSGGSFSNPMTTAGDLIYGSTTGSPSVPDRLGIGTTGQVLTVIDGLPAWGAGVAGSVPTGTLLPFAGTTAPGGYLLCDGAAVSRTTYATLFSVIGTTYGTGDGSTTFNLPNAQGVFLRGAGSQTITVGSANITYTGTQGTTQGDQMQGHQHRPGQYSILQAVQMQTGGSGYDALAENSSGTDNWGNTDNPTSDGTNGTPRTGAETRPANISVLYIIKD